MMTFIVAALTVFFIRKNVIQQKDKSAEESFRKDLTACIKYIIRNKIIFNLLCPASIVTFFTGILQSLFVPIILSFADKDTYGYSVWSYISHLPDRDACKLLVLPEFCLIIFLTRCWLRMAAFQIHPGE